MTVKLQPIKPNEVNLNEVFSTMCGKIQKQKYRNNLKKNYILRKAVVSKIPAIHGIKIK